MLRLQVRTTKQLKTHEGMQVMVRGAAVVCTGGAGLTSGSGRPMLG